MKLSDLTSLPELFDNMYQFIRTKKITEKEFIKFPQLPVNLSKYQNFESSIIPEEDLGDLKQILSQKRSRTKHETLKYQLKMFNELIEYYKRSKLLSTYYSDNINSSDRIIEQSHVKRKDLFVMFSDIRDFTTISEALDADEVAFFLSEYFSKIFFLTNSLNIRIDKIIGDAYLALADSERSIAWFTAQINYVIRKFNEYFQSNPTPKHEEINYKLQTKIGFRKGLQIRSGIGIHYGPLIKGDIGTYERADHTVIGDTVNIAARLEGLTKKYMTDDDVTLCIYSKEVIQNLKPWAKARMKQLEKNDPYWRDNLASVKNLHLPSSDNYQNELRLTLLSEQNANYYREIIGYSLKGKKRAIRIFTDEPYAKEFKPHVRLYNESIKRYHMGGNSMFLAYQQLTSLVEQVKNDKIVDSALDAVAENLSDYFFELCKNKIKRDANVTSHAYSQGVVHLKFGNYHQAIANFMDFLNYKYRDNVTEYKEFTDKYMSSLNELANQLNYKKALLLAPKFSETYTVLENLVSSNFHLLSEIPGFNNFMSTIEDNINEWKTLILKTKHKYAERLKLIPIILLYSKLFNKHCDDLQLYHPIIDDWEQELITKEENNDDLGQLNIKEVYTTIKLSRYKVQDKTKQILKFQFFVNV